MMLIQNFILLTLAAAWRTGAQTAPLPTPPGSTNVHITTFPLTDHSRIDPYAPCCNHPRRLMLSLFQPATCSHITPIPYMPPATAAFHDAMLAELGIPNGTFELFRLQTCASVLPNVSQPLLVFSTGMGSSRHTYNLMLQWISSLGFNVVSIDHPYDADIVEFPDGTVILGANISIPAGIAQDISVRVADVSFVLDALSNKSISDQLKTPQFNTTKVGVFGHSLGGATAGDAMVVDTRIAAGLNMDGSMFGAATNHTDKRPFTIFASSGHNQSDDSSWASFWANLKGFKLQLEVNNTRHTSYTDYPILAKTLGIPPDITPQIAEFIGTIDGQRIVQILRTYIGAFFQHVLEMKTELVLQGPSKANPEVSFRNASMNH